MSAYIYGFTSLRWVLWSLLLYSIITYFLHIIFAKIRSKPLLSFFDFFPLFLYKSSIYISLSFIFIGWFLYYQNTLFPAKIPTYTLSNGDKTIIFQTMSHIGSESFYANIQHDIYAAKKQDYVLYYEWVQAGSEENNAAFNEALGIDFAPWIYDNFSRLYGVRAQDNNEFLWLVNNLDYNIDLDLDRVMQLYRDRVWSEQKASILWNEKVYDLNSDVLKTLSQLSEKELIVLRFVNQGILNFMMKHASLRNIIIQNLWNTDIFSVILEGRNSFLAKEIQTRNDKKIFITYWLMHFSWVYEILKSMDENWEIIDTKYYQVISRS